MNKRFLVTTAIDETLPENQPILLLGEWCKPFSKKKKFDNLDFKVLPYHWDDRSKLYKDYLYLDEFYEKLLKELTIILNKIHGTKHKVKYWRILIGPWLGFFIQIIFDRWSSVKYAINKFELSGTYIQSYQEELLTPNNMRHFAKHTNSEQWNHYIYSFIIKNFTKINCINQTGNYEIIKERTIHQAKLSRIVKKKIFDCINILGKIFQKKDDAFFINSYLSKKNEILLSLKFLQIPMFNIDNFLDDLDIKFENNKRNWRLLEKNNNEFEVFARLIIPYQIPKIYLEGYNTLNEKVSFLSWPEKPKVILTGSSFIDDDIFKLYAAQKTENGSPLAINQHGGGFGSYLFIFNENHQLKISDLFLSWGWEDKSKPNVKPVCYLKYKKPLYTKNKNQKKILFIAGKGPSYSTHIWSAPKSACQWIIYFNEQCKFINTLNSKIHDNLIIRLKTIEKGWEPSYDRWKDQFPKIYIDKGHSDINTLINKSKLYIGTYNASTSVECFSLGVPVVIYWNPYYWEINNSAKVYFDNLRKAGVFHDSPESAAKHVNLIWENIDDWWKSEKVTKAVNLFKNNYCYDTFNLVDKVYNTLENEIINSKKN